MNPDYRAILQIMKSAVTRQPGVLPGLFPM